MTESNKNFVRFNIFLKTAEFNCLLNNFAEIFVAVFLFADVLNALPADNILYCKFCLCTNLSAA